MKKPRLMRLKFLACVCTLGIATTSIAASYQFEANGRYATTDQGRQDTDVLSFGGTAHLKPVNTAGHPLAEAAFLEKSSYASLDYVDITADVGDFERDYDGFALNGRYVFPDTDVIVEATFETGDLDTIGVGGGVYLDGRTTVIGFVESRDDNAGDVDVIGAKYRLLTTIKAGNSLAIGAQLKLIDAGRDDAIEVNGEADYYVNDYTSVGAQLSVTQGDFDAFGFGIRGQHFITPQAAIALAVMRVDPDKGKAADTISLHGLLRF